MDPFLRHLHIADNIKILRNLCTASVHLIYLDPPFNSGKQWENPVQVEPGKKLRVAFKDAWHLSDIHVDEAAELQRLCPKAMEVINALHHVNGDSWRAYLIYMGVRLVEMCRVLKDTGSIYYHCDPTMSHGIKLIMDAIFGGKNFRNEIIWKKTNSPKAQSNAYGGQHDVIFFYSKGESFTYNRPYSEPTAEYLKSFRFSDERGRYQTVALSNTTGSGGFAKMKTWEWRGVTARWIYSFENLEKFWVEGLIVKTKNGGYRKKHYLSQGKGSPVSDLWVNKDVGPLQGRASENRGYATQKPLALLERVVKTSSNVSDLVLDPFCGCATACVAAERLGRQWIGIDIAGVDERIKDTDKTYKVEDLLFERIDRDCREGTLFSMKKTYQLNPKIGEDSYKRIDLHPYVKNDLRANLHAAQGRKCIGCDKEKAIEDMDLDHIIPRERGGQDEPRNYQLLCGTCNSIKGSKTQTAWRRKVLEKRLEEELERETKLMLERRRKMKLKESE